jgi:hypothetical protein
MSSSQELYSRIVHTLNGLVSVAHIAQLNNWAWLTVGIIQAQSVALGQVVTHLPWTAKAESRIARVRRWLSNSQVDGWRLYEPVLAHALRDWRATHAYVILDGLAVFGDRWQIFRLSLLHGGRAIPLVWVVRPGKGLTQVEALRAMLERAAQFLAPRVKSVTFLADRGFRDCDWAELCLKIGWHYDIRIAANTYLVWADGRSASLAALVPPGRNRYFQQVSLTQQAKLATHVSVTWTADAQPDMVAVISDRPAGPARLREYARRMGIEQSFRDDQSGGFDLEHTQLRHAERLERLLLAVALATLWCHELGEHVLHTGETARRDIDPGPTRELSLFQLGLRWLKRCVSTALHRLPTFLARLSPLKLAPVIKSAPS